MEINIKAQKGLRSFVLIILSGIGVFLTVSAAQYGYQVWTRAREQQEEPITPAAVEELLPTPTPTLSTPSQPSESLFEPLVEEEESPNILNYSEFVEAYGTNDPKYDFNEDGIVDNDDFELFKQKYQRANP